jgi:hypothetical protein
MTVLNLFGALNTKCTSERRLLLFDSKYFTKQTLHCHRFWETGSMQRNHKLHKSSKNQHC